MVMDRPDIALSVTATQLVATVLRELVTNAARLAVDPTWQDVGELGPSGWRAASGDCMA
jgi:two-component sensor histidine kinase